MKPSSIIVLCVAAVMAATAPGPAAGQRFAANGPYNAPAGKSPTAELLREVKLEQQLDGALPLDALFRDEAGHPVRLGECFGEKPVVLALVYYRCPMLCTQVLNGLLRVAQAIPEEIGRDYEVVTISFDPSETAELAAEKKAHYTQAYRREGAERGWHFLTGDQASIDRVTKAVRFGYRLDAASRQFAHPSGFIVATPQGRIARYFYGIDYAPRDLQLALLESSRERIGSPVAQLLLLCYHYDPLTGKYGLAISAVLKMAGLATVGGLGLFLVMMCRREKRFPKLFREATPDSPKANGTATDSSRLVAERGS